MSKLYYKLLLCYILATHLSPAEDRHKMATECRHTMVSLKLTNHPLYIAIQESMVDITQRVNSNDIMDHLVAARVLTMHDLEEYAKLTNKSAVMKIMVRVLSSIEGCNKFLKILQEQSELPVQYEELSKIITARLNTTECSYITQYTNQVQPTHADVGESDTDVNYNVICPKATEEILQESQEVMNTLLKQNPKMMSIVNIISAKKNTGKSFIEFLLYIIKLFLNAIDDSTVYLKQSVKQSVKFQLKGCFVTLRYTYRIFCCNKEHAEHIKESLTIVALQSEKTLDIIKSIQKPCWLKFSQSAKTISALLPIFEKITRVVQGINNITADACVAYSKLLGSVEDLKANLVKIKSVLSKAKAIQTVGLSTALIFAVGGVTCVIVGGILLITPAAPAGLPLVTAGGLATVISSVVLCSTMPLHCINSNQTESVDLDGYKAGQQLSRRHPSFINTTMLESLQQ